MAEVPVSPTEVEAAAQRIAGHVRQTPVLSLGTDAGAWPFSVVLKLELLQHSGSFKARGAFNWLLSRAPDLPRAGVVAASGGNFGVAMAYASRELGVPATIVVPEVTSPVKRARLSDLGANVVVVPGVYADALAASQAMAVETGALLAHAYDHPDIVAGQGTCGLELDQQAAGAIDTVLVAVGGGGLIGGVAAWFSGRVRVVGVEPERIPTLHAALAAGQPVDVEVSGLAADSLGASSVGAVPFAVARRFVDQVVLVSDESIAQAQRDLWARCRIASEPGGAAAWAGVLAGGYRPEPDERVAVILCGGNVDLTSLGSA
ncbi:MAG TPA: threonine/serine dehydratase [Acidimicrobiales bacterium]|jgi:threonine dehydratase